MLYDVIVVGAGSAGAVIAARLTEDAERSVLLLEAGPDYPTQAELPDDILNGYWNSTRAHDWRFRAHHTQIGRPHMFPRGRVTGGSSAVNTTIALRGVPEDYDGWAALGNDAWSWERILPYFRLIERDVDFADDFHGQSGPLPIRRYKEQELVNWQRAFVEACRTAGYPEAADNNDPNSTGVGPHPMNREGRLRISTAIAYLTDARGRPNLTIRSGAHVRRVLLQGERAVGVELDLDGAGESVFGRQIVLSAGAIQSPAILIRSGIGGRDALDPLGVPCLVDRPGVGEHLTDHPTVGVTFRPRAGVCRTDVPSVQVTMRYTATGSDQRNDVQVMPVSFYNSPDGPVFPIGVCLEQVRGCGRLVVESLNPRAQPRIESRFCEDPEDLRRMVEGIRIALRLAETEPLAALHTGVRGPSARHLESDEALGEWIRVVADSGYHPSGTAKMGPSSDPLTVVDQFGRVYGVDGLVVADASIMPTVPRANTNLTSIVIGERAAEWLRDGTIAAPNDAVRSSSMSSFPSHGGQGTANAQTARPAGPTSPYLRARNAAAEYLVRRQREDGAIGDPANGMGGFYKGMYALTAAGQTRAAAWLAAWLRTNACTPDGDYAGDWERGGLADVYPYANAWITAGLHRAGEYDLSRRGIDFLASLQDPGCGGLFTRLNQRGSDERIEVMSSAMAGIAALLCGRQDVADGVARFLRVILDAQPEPERVLYHVFTPARGVVTEFPDNQASAYAVFADRPLQAYFMYGIGAAFMTKYALAAGDSRALEDAGRFLLPALHARDAMYETAQVGKVAWGAALLAGVTGQKTIQALAVRSAGALLAQQNPDGSWDNTGGYSREEMRDEVTAEFVLIMDEVEHGLASVPVSELPAPPSHASFQRSTMAEPGRR